jgi:two-component system sensor kinase FixL
MTSGSLSDKEVALAVEAAELGAWCWDVASGDCRGCVNAKTLLGLDAAAPLTYDGFLAALHADDRERVDAALRRALAERSDYDFEFRVPLPADRVRWLRAKGRSITDDAGRPTRLHGILVDVSARKRVETTLREREAWLGSILETAPDAVIVIDEKGVIESFSVAAEKLFGYGAAEVVGRNISTLMPSPHREQHDDYMARYLRTGERRIIGIGRVVSGQRKDGGTFPMELAVGEITVEGRRLFTGFARDITERQKTQRRLQELHSELVRVTRANEIGQMGAALAHELNQPLTAVGNYLQACRRFLDAQAQPPSPRVLETIEKASAQAARAGQVIRRLRQFMEKGETEQRPEDVNKIVEEASALALVGVKDAGVRVQLELGAGVPPIRVDKIQIQQVVLNLVRNAVEAMAPMPERVLTIRTAAASEPDFVEVTVSDTGPGLAQTVTEQLFQPFVTTKERGMGIGLSVCRSIIDAHGGRIWAAPNHGGGTTFAFIVPVAA